MHKKQLINHLNRIATAPSPLGWELVTMVVVGELTEVGFSKKENCLLMISSSGRGLFDCLTGQRIGRDVEADGEWLNLAAFEQSIWGQR